MLNSDGRVRELVSKDRDTGYKVCSMLLHVVCIIYVKKINIYIHHTAMIILLSLGCFNCLYFLGCIWQGH